MMDCPEEIDWQHDDSHHETALDKNAAFDSRNFMWELVSTSMLAAFWCLPHDAATPIQHGLYLHHTWWLANRQPAVLAGAVLLHSVLRRRADAVSSANEFRIPCDIGYGTDLHPCMWECLNTTPGLKVNDKTDFWPKSPVTAKGAKSDQILDSGNTSWDDDSCTVLPDCKMSWGEALRIFLAFTYLMLSLTR